MCLVSVGDGTFSWAAAGGGNEFASGLYIGGTASTNLLTDYEKGTWTPTVTSSHTGSYPATGYRYGYYERVGDWATVGFDIRFNGGAGGATTYTLTNITNLPFTVLNFSGNNALGYTGIRFPVLNTTDNNSTSYHARTFWNTTTVYFAENGSSTQVFTVPQFGIRTVGGVLKYRVL